MSLGGIGKDNFASDNDNLLYYWGPKNTSSQARFLLKEHCDATQLYLQHDLTLQQLAQTIGTNRNYLSQYFSRQGITYNTYINNLRINHFINCYQEVAGSKQPFSVQQLACENVLYIFGNATFLTATMP